MTLPSAETMAILRRAAGGHVAVRGADHEDGRWFAYEDGTAIRDSLRRLMTQRGFCRLVREGWLLPGADVGLWRARTVADGEPAKAQEDDVRMTCRNRDRRRTRP